MKVKKLRKLKRNKVKCEKKKKSRKTVTRDQCIQTKVAKVKFD